MKARSFLIANLAGAVVWTTGISLLGYFAGDTIGEDNIDKYLLPIVAAIVVLSMIPPLLEYRNHKRDQTAH